LFLAAAVPARAQSVDTAGAGALIAQAMDHSEVMQNLQYLSDVIGPRLSGSAAMKRANEWTAQRYRDYGLTASLESYPFGVTWERGEASLRLTSPFKRQITAHSWAWTQGTPKGAPVSGPVVRINGSADSLDTYLPKVKGAWARDERAGLCLESRWPADDGRRFSPHARGAAAPHGGLPAPRPRHERGRPPCRTAGQLRSRLESSRRPARSAC
jgi:hypothetical protein